MAIRYNSADASSAWPEGEYDATIASVEETKSKKSGADMWKLGVKVYNRAGQERIVTDFIVVPTGLFKLEQIARAFGRGAEFKDETFEPGSVKDRRLTVTLKVTEGSGDFPEKNEVKKYAAASGGSQATHGPVKDPSMVQVLRERESVGASPVSNEQQFKDSDIPFDRAHASVE